MDELLALRKGKEPDTYSTHPTICYRTGKTTKTNSIRRQSCSFSSKDMWNFSTHFDYNVVLEQYVRLYKHNFIIFNLGQHDTFYVCKGKGDVAVWILNFTRTHAILRHLYGFLLLQFQLFRLIWPNFGHWFHNWIRVLSGLITYPVHVTSARVHVSFWKLLKFNSDNTSDMQGNALLVSYMSLWPHLA